jgi:hypothetical protein
MVLLVNPSGPVSARHLYLPLRPAQLVQHLDRAGAALISGQVSLAQEEAVTQTDNRGVPDLNLPTTPMDATSVLAGSAMVSLKRWPGAALLHEDSHFLKLASGLTGRPTLLADLARRTATDLDVCRAFVTRAAASGLLTISGNEPPAKPSASAAPQAPVHDPWGLALSRPVSPQAATAPTARAAETETAVAVRGGLLERIRRRLMPSFFKTGHA